MKRVVFLRGDDKQKQEVISELSHHCPSFGQDFRTTTADIASLRYQQKRQPIPNEGLLKTRMVRKIQTDRPCVMLLCYQEHEMERMKKEVAEIKEIQKYKTVRALFLVQLKSEEGVVVNQDGVDFEWWIKKTSEIESKHLLYYSETVNAKKLLKAIEE